MSTSAIGTVKDALRAALVIRAGLAGVSVFSGSVSAEEAGVECIALGDARLNEEAMSMGGNRSEAWDVDCECRVVKPWATSTETTIKAARDRALALLAEVETHVNDTYVGTFPDVEFKSGGLTEGFGPEGRICSATFTLTVTNIKNP